MANGIRSCFIYSLIGIWTLIGIGVVFPLSYLTYRFSGKEKQWIFRCLIKLYGRGVLWILSPWVTIRTSGLAAVRHLEDNNRDLTRDRPPEKGLLLPSIVVVNHLSMLDLFCLSLLPEVNGCLFARTWPFKVPVMGYFMRKAGYMNVDEAGFDELLEKVRQEKASGAMVVIFPEGRRSPTGKLQRLRSGAFKLSIETDLAIVPMRIEGTGEALAKGNFMIYPAEVSVNLLEEICPSSVHTDDGNVCKSMMMKTAALLQPEIPT